MGAYVTLAGVALFTIAVFLDWLSADIGDSARVDGPGSVASGVPGQGVGSGEA